MGAIAGSAAGQASYCIGGLLQLLAHQGQLALEGLGAGDVA
ncbi:hypothetical protein [Pseudonocardia autotrophica]|nr:hypothetical protein [Pseudonocardia autotrophica]